MPPRLIPTALPIAVRLPDPPRVQPPPLPGARDLNRFDQGDPRRRGRLGADDNEAAPLNAWVTKVSTWVLRSRFDLADGATAGDWYVEFLDGSLVVYHNTPTDVWRDFYASMSWGQFIHYRCAAVGRAYEELRGPQRHVTQRHRKMRDVAANEGRR